MSKEKEPLDPEIQKALESMKKTLSTVEKNDKLDGRMTLRKANDMIAESWKNGDQEVKNKGLWLDLEEIYPKFLDAQKDKSYFELAKNTRLLLERSKLGYWNFLRESDVFFKSEEYKLLLQIYNIERLKCWTANSVQMTMYWEERASEMYDNEIFPSKIEKIDNFENASYFLLQKIEELSLKKNIVKEMGNGLINFKEWKELLLSSKLINISIFNFMCDPQFDDDNGSIRNRWDGLVYF